MEKRWADLGSSLGVERLPLLPPGLLLCPDLGQLRLLPLQLCLPVRHLAEVWLHYLQHHSRQHLKGRECNPPPCPSP